MNDREQATAAAATLLAWYREMGVDAAVSDTAENWLAEHGRTPSRLDLGGTEPAPTGASAPAASRRAPERTAAPATQPTTRPTAVAPAPASPASPPAAVRQFPTSTPDAAETAARKIARSATTLEALEAGLAGFDGCALKATAKSLCFYRGSPSARVMIIGEAPGREEDLAGKPFVGRAGQLLDKMLASIALDERSVHITNIVYWRPPGNRTPTPQEAQVCRPFLERQIELVAPEILLLLGGPAAKAVLDVADGIMKLRGSWRQLTIGGHHIKVMPSLHPAYLLRTPAAKRQAWKDLLSVRLALDASRGPLGNRGADG